MAAPTEPTKNTLTPEREAQRPAPGTGKQVPPPPLPDRTHAEPEYRSEAMQMVPFKPGGRRVAMIIVSLIVLIALILTFVPWQQTVEAKGQVAIYDAMSRPQNIEARIPGELVEWRVQEGERVRAGQVVARISDIEQRFLDPEQPRFVRNQIEAQQNRKREEEARVERIRGQVGELRQSRENAIEAAQERVRQSEARREIARQNLEQSRRILDATREVQQENAKIQREQAQERRKQAEQSLGIAEVNRDQKKYERDLIKDLYEQELRSQLELNRAETAYQEQVKRVEVAKQALEVARKDVDRTANQIREAELNVKRQQAAVISAQEAINAADREIAQLRADLEKVKNDTQANINVAEANLQSALAGLQQINDTLNGQQVTLRNLERRVEQQDIIAPRDGRVVRLAAVGAGETVKAGDVLAVLAPANDDLAVEMTLQGFDAPLVTVGRKVRLQFNGFPALQITGFPQVAVGTFGGEIFNIDPIDDGTGRIRIWVRPDEDSIRNAGDQPWPKPEVLRPGTDVIGWVMLDMVPLGYELWRQFNGFPPSVRQVPSNLGKGDKGGDSGDKGDGPKSADIKRRKL
ncbi:MAG: HlyD family efflux transporter periplasmic adaptor subunit [Armatimonadaceae bacterium]